MEETAHTDLPFPADFACRPLLHLHGGQVPASLAFHTFHQLNRRQAVCSSLGGFCFPEGNGDGQRRDLRHPRDGLNKSTVSPLVWRESPSPVELTVCGHKTRQAFRVLHVVLEQEGNLWSSSRDAPRITTSWHSSGSISTAVKKLGLT